MKKIIFDSYSSSVPKSLDEMLKGYFLDALASLDFTLVSE